MTRLESLALSLTLLLLMATGLAVAVSRYLLPHDDPFSVVGAPWEPSALAVHVVVAPLFIFAVGNIFQRHALRRLTDRRPEGRRSGLAIVALLAPAILSGYLLQVTTAVLGHQILVVTHLASGAALFALQALHLLVRPTRNLEAEPGLAVPAGGRFSNSSARKIRRPLDNSGARRR